MKGRYLYVVIVVMFLLAICSLPFVKIPISVTSFGIVNDLESNNPIISMVEGKILRSKIKRNNQVFKEGDTLIEVNNDQLKEIDKFQNNQLFDYNAQLYDLNLLASGNVSNVKTGVYQRQASAYQEKVAQLQSSLDLAKRDFERVKKLFDAGIYTQAEYDKNMYNVKNIDQQIDNFKEQQFAVWQGEKRDLERVIRENRSTINTTRQQSDNFIITSPANGRLMDYSGLSTGSYITPGTKIGVISPEESLVIEARVSPRDIGFIKLNQKIKVQVDTYNYNQWGLLAGKVIEIQKNVSYDEKNGQPYFLVLCSMDKNYLKLKSGYKANVEKGMTVSVRFYLLDRTLWQLLFDNVDDWFNPNLGK